MKIKEFIQRYKIVLFLSFLVVVLIFIKFIYGQPEEAVQKTVITPTPTMIFSEEYPEEMLEISE